MAKNQDNDDKKKNKGQQQQKDLAHEPGIVAGVFKQLLGDVAEQWPEHQDFKYLEKIQVYVDEKFGEDLGKLVVTTGIGAAVPTLQAALLGFGVPGGIVWSASDVFKDFTDGVRRRHREKGKLTQTDLSDIRSELFGKYQQRAKDETSYSEMAQQLPETARLELVLKTEAFIGGNNVQDQRFGWWRRQIKTTHMLDTLVRLPVTEWEAHLKQIIGDPPVEKPKVDNSMLTQGMKSIGGFAQRNIRGIIGLEAPGAEVQQLQERVKTFTEQQASALINESRELERIRRAKRR